MRFILLIAVLLVLSGCESVQQSRNIIRAEVAKPITLSAKQIASIRAGVAKTLKNDLQTANVGRMLAGRTSTAVIVCGFVNGKNSVGEPVTERPFHGVFMGMDNASGFIVTGTGGAD